MVKRGQGKAGKELVRPVPDLQKKVPYGGPCYIFAKNTPLVLPCAAPYRTTNNLSNIFL